MAFSAKIIGAAILASIALAGCDDDPAPQLTQATSNPAINVDLLFVVDGCKVYRFQDEGYNRYLTTCPGSVGWREHIGKTTHDVEVPTGGSR